MQHFGGLRCGWIARKFHVYISSRKRSFWNCRLLESVCAETKIFHRYDSVFFSDSFGHKHREIYWSGSSDVSSYETTKKNTFEVSYFIWTVYARSCMSGLSFYNINILSTFGTICCLGFMLFTAFAYTCIGIKAISAERTRMKLSPPLENRKEKARFLKELKFAKSCFIIVTCYVLCFTPVAVFLGAMLSKLSHSNYIIAVAWCVNLVMLNSSLNSLIFFWRSRQLRRETIIFLKRMIPSIMGE